MEPTWNKIDICWSDWEVTSYRASRRCRFLGEKSPGNSTVTAWNKTSCCPKNLLQWYHVILIGVLMSTFMKEHKWTYGAPSGLSALSSHHGTAGKHCAIWNSSDPARSWFPSCATSTLWRALVVEKKMQTRADLQQTKRSKLFSFVCT